jgi:hypothetical protein
LNVYIIGYDLNRPGQDYADLIGAIKDLGGWWHYLDSTWLLATDTSAAAIRDTLKEHVDAGDELLVARLQGEWASCGLPKDATDWIRKHLAA